MEIATLSFRLPIQLCYHNVKGQVCLDPRQHINTAEIRLTLLSLLYSALGQGNNVTKGVTIRSSEVTIRRRKHKCSATESNCYHPVVGETRGHKTEVILEE